MLTFIVAIGVAACTYFALVALSLSPIWSAVIAFIVLLGVQLLIALLLRAMSKKITVILQSIMQETQFKLQTLQNRFMQRPTSQKEMMRAFEREQYAGLDRMLDALKLYEPLYRWNFMLKKQVNSMRMMFLYQKKDFAGADALMPRCVFYDPQSVAMKMARMYTNKTPGLEKFFKKKSRSLKGNDAVLPFALYSWILVKEEKYEDAIKVLSDAKKKTSNEVIAQNLDTLLNQKYKHFSNSRLGDIWYSLYLEEPKMPKAQQQQQMRYRG